MASNASAFGKDPLNPSHGESLADQSFQGLKSKEVRDSASPLHDIKFHSLALNQPNSTGWNVQTSSEINPDGHGYRTETIATTGGVEKINGGTAEFQGRNEQRASVSQEGDDKNFVKKASESSNTHLQENIVVGDENSGRTEMKSSTTTSSSSSQVYSSSSTVEHGNEPWSEKFISDNSDLHKQQLRSQQQKTQHLNEKHLHDQTKSQQHQEQYSNEYQSNRRESTNSQSVEHQKVQEKTRRVVDLDKSSAEYQQHVQYLMSQPGEIISNTVEYPKPNVKMITTVKRLPDGTIVKNKRYETEATASEAEQYRHNSTTNQQTSTQRQHENRIHDEKKLYNNQKHSDHVDNVQTNKHLVNENVNQSFKTVKESKQRYSTQSTSQTTEERADRDFSTHGFPSVRADIPTQEFPTDRPHDQSYANDKKYVIETNKPNVEYSTYTNENGEVVTVKKQTQKSMKQKSASERIVQSEVIVDGEVVSREYHPERITQSTSSTNKSDSDFSTHGFPSVKEPSIRQSTPNRDFSAPSQSHTYSPKADFTSHGFPSVRPDKLTQEFPSERPHAEEIHIKHGTQRNVKQSSNTERIIETEIIRDGDYHSHGQPTRSSPQKSPDFSTHGFPSVKSTTKTTTDFTTQGFPSASPKGNVKPTQTQRNIPVTNHTTKKTTTTSDTSTKVLQKEKEVDAAHRAFAASLRSESPIDGIRRDSYSDHQRYTPRSSISSNRTYRRDGREGSHDSATPSETSRISSATVTRQSPSKSVGKTVVTKQSVKSRKVNGSNETIDLTPQRSIKTPSPSKTVTSKTTTSSTLRSTVTKPKPATTSLNDNSPKPDNQFNNPDNKIIPINHEPLTKIKDTRLLLNDASFHRNEVVEEPCIKKHFYQLGPSDKLTHNLDETTQLQNQQQQPLQMTKEQTTKEMADLLTDMLDSFEVPVKNTSKFHEKSPNSPILSNYVNHTHLNKTSPNRDAITDNKADIIVDTEINTSKFFNQPKEPKVEDNILIKENISDSNNIKKINQLSLRKLDDIKNGKETNKINEKATSTFLTKDNRKKLNTNTNELFINIEKTHSQQEDVEPTTQNNVRTKPTSPFKESSPIRNVSKKTSRESSPLKEYHTVDENTEKNISKTINKNESKHTENSPIKETETKINTFRLTTESTEHIDSPMIHNKKPVNRPASPLKEQKKPIRRENSPIKENETSINKNVKEKSQQKYSSSITKDEFINEKQKPIFRGDSPTKETDIIKKQDDKPVEKLDSPVKEIKQPHFPEVVDNKKPRDRSTSPIKENKTNINKYESTSIKKDLSNTRFNKKINTTEQFIENERLQRDETPDGAFISKPHDSTPTSPTFKKKGVSPRETFEDRCRQILGMEHDGDTQGTYKTNKEDNVKKVDTTTFKVTLEDCIENEPYYPNNNGPHTQSPQKEKNTNKPKIFVDDDDENDYLISDSNESTTTVTEKINNISKDKLSKTAKPTSNINENSETSVFVETVHLKQNEEQKVKNEPVTIIEVVSETENTEDEKKCVSEKIINRNKKSFKEHLVEIPVSKQPNKKFTPVKLPTTSEQKKTQNLTDKRNSIKTAHDNTSKKPATISTNQHSNVLHKSTKKENQVEELINKRSSRKSSTDSLGTTIKERLRSSTRKQSQCDKVDGDSSSELETSPNRLNERRRSSNISVHTEIIIEHNGPKTPSPEKVLPKKTSIGEVNNTVTEKINRRNLITERKESAPVQRVTRKEVDNKMLRSTSENVIKITKQQQKPDMNSLKPERRPNKCFSTKTINLTNKKDAVDNIEVDNVIIDIQHAKSSREQSPNKIVPTPVPDNLEIHNPRYPDVVQEPEDHPKKNVIVTNIPIFEEETNEYVGCHISEVNFDRMSRISDEILNTPTVEAPSSLEYPSIDKPDDDCLLTVVEKVSKFTNSVEEVKKPKVSSPFTRVFDKSPSVPADDDCLLSVDQKVTKFLKTAEEVTKPITPVREISRPKFEDIDEELRKDDCNLSVSQKVSKFIDSAEKLKPTAPQKSPELVARMERQISKQSEIDNEVDESTEKVDITIETEKVVLESEDELLPMTKDHTTVIELKRQKDILSRPSVFKDKQTGIVDIRPNSSKPIRTNSNKTDNLTTRKNLFDTTENLKKKSIHLKNEDTEVENYENEEKIDICKQFKKQTIRSVSPQNEPISKTNKPNEVIHSPTYTSTKSKTAQITESTQKHNIHSNSTVSKDNEKILTASKDKKVLPLTTGRNRVPIDTVAARRNIFEKTSPSKVSKPESPTQSPRRPSYMEHTKSSLEHTRRDSLEINKTNYSRKVSIEDEIHERRPNTAVKFDVPLRSTKKISISDDINIEEIFDLEVLEELLEQVTTYEMRRRIRAQIRLVKKNISVDKQTSTKTATSAYKKSSSTYSSQAQYEETDNQHKVKKTFDSPLEKTKPRTDNSPIEEVNRVEKYTEVIRERSHSPMGKTISSSLKEVRRHSGKESSITKHYTHEEHSEFSSEMSDIQGSRSNSPDTKFTHTRYASPDGNKSLRSKSPEGKFKPISPTQNKSYSKVEESFSSTKKSYNSADHIENHKKTEEKTPIWTDRKKVLKNQSSINKNTPVTPNSRTNVSKSIKNISHSKTMEDDSIISSYGIGPTDENGLPLFGIRALKTKKSIPTSTANEEVTGYVIEEKYYSDGKTKPISERKEYIYSTNANELEKVKKKVESARTSKNDNTVTKTYQKIDKNFIPKEVKAIKPNNSDELFKASSKSVRRGSVKEMSEKFIRKESSQSINEQQSKRYPKAGLILRTNSRSGTSDAGGDCYETSSSSATKYTKKTNSNLQTDEESESDCKQETQYSKHIVTESESECESVKMRTERKSSTKTTRSFLNTTGEERIVSGIDDVLERMRNADNVIEVGDTKEDQEARALLNKFLGASVIMSGVEAAIPIGQTQTSKTTIYTTNGSGNNSGKVKTTRVTTKTTKSESSSTPVVHKTCDIEEIWDEAVLKELLENSNTYEERRKIRARLRELMADRTEKVDSSTTEKTETKEKDGAVVTTTTKVTTRTVAGNTNKPVSPFAKFRQLDKQNSQQSPKSPSTPTTPGGTASPSGSGVIFKFTDPALNARAATVKEQLLQWCQIKTQEYENVQITNFSSSWSDGLAFCALIHHFLPDAFDYSKLTTKNRRHNFELAFTVADEKAGIAPLLDVDDMVVMKRPDWKCVFVYVQSIYRRFRNCQ